MKTSQITRSPKSPKSGLCFCMLCGCYLFVIHPRNQGAPWHCGTESAAGNLADSAVGAGIGYRFPTHSPSLWWAAPFVLQVNGLVPSHGIASENRQAGNPLANPFQALVTLTSFANLVTICAETSFISSLLDSGWSNVKNLRLDIERAEIPVLGLLLRDTVLSKLHNPVDLQFPS